MIAPNYLPDFFGDIIHGLKRRYDSFFSDFLLSQFSVVHLIMAVITQEEQVAQPVILRISVYMMEARRFTFQILFASLTITLRPKCNLSFNVFAHHTYSSHFSLICFANRLAPNRLCTQSPQLAHKLLIPLRESGRPPFLRFYRFLVSLRLAMYS